MTDKMWSEIGKFDFDREEKLPGGKSPPGWPSGEGV